MPASRHPGPRTSDLGLLLLLWSCAAAPLAAQIPPPGADSLPSDSARVDSLRRESTERLLAAEALATQQVAVMTDLGSEGPRALGSRVVLDRQAVAWRTAETVSDLLAGVPGTYVWRGGWHARSAYVNYRGRGATGIEWVLDGVPFAAMGPDSIGIDPTQFPLSFLERVEIERWPGGLRVLLYTAQHRWLAPRTRVGAATGQFDIARYQADLEYRWKNGLGFTAAADYLDSPTASGLRSRSALTGGLVRAQWTPRPGSGVQVQYLTQSPDRDPFVSEGDTLDPGVSGTRNELQARASLRRGSEARHLQADLLYTRSAWSGDSVDQTVKGGGLVLAYRASRFRVAGSTWLRDRWTPLTLRGEAGYAPPGPLSVSGELVHEGHDGDRTSDWVGLRGGLALPFGLEGEAGWRNGSRVWAPALASDTAQPLDEVEFRGRWRSRVLTLEAGWSRTGAATPYRFAAYRQVAALRPLGTTRWVEYGARLSPLEWVSLEGWVSDPQGTTVDGMPPTHSVIRGEIRSKFLRKYPSGIFELRLAAEIENWGTGVIGRDSLDAPIALRGATFVRLGAALRLGGFQFFYDRTNTQSTKLTYVPGFRIPALGQTFGMRWEFRN